MCFPQTRRANKQQPRVVGRGEFPGEIAHVQHRRAQPLHGCRIVAGQLEIIERRVFEIGRNVRGFLEVARALAGIHEKSLEEIGKFTSENFAKLFSPALT